MVLGIFKALSILALKASFVTAASGMLAYMNTIQQIPDSTDRLVASAAVGLATLFAGVASSAAGEGAGLLLHKAKTGHPWGEIMLASAFDRGGSKFKLTRRLATVGLIAGLAGGYICSKDYVTEKFKPSTSATEPAAAQNLAVKLNLL